MSFTMSLLLVATFESDHRNGGSSRAGEMAPAIGNLLVDIQYPTCKPHEKITTQPCLEAREWRLVGHVR
jgi:hypothetical protein